jgi:hypothetical protein
MTHWLAPDAASGERGRCLETNAPSAHDADNGDGATKGMAVAARHISVNSLSHEESFSLNLRPNLRATFLEDLFADFWIILVDLQSLHSNRSSLHKPDRSHTAKEKKRKNGRESERERETAGAEEQRTLRRSQTAAAQSTVHCPKHRSERQLQDM